MKRDLDDETISKLMVKFKAVAFPIMYGNPRFMCSVCMKKRPVQTIYQMDGLNYCSKCIIKKLKEKAINSLFDEI